MNKYDWEAFKEFFAWFFIDFTIYDYIFVVLIGLWTTLAVSTMYFGLEIF